MSGTPLLVVQNLVVQYRSRRSLPPLRAVDDVSLTINTGETVGLVGESGSGKSTLGRAILGLASVHDGTIRFQSRDISHARFRERQAMSSALQAIFQDPYGSLNPARTIGQTLAEPVRVHDRLDRDTLAGRTAIMLELVGLPTDAARRFPGEFSGGQRQRIAIARALMTSPRLVICDEPTSALDLSIQAQILNLLSELQRSMNISYLLISHDLSVVRHLAHRIIVLYKGQIMETGSAATVYDQPSHPYSQTLLAATPLHRGRNADMRSPDRPAIEPKVQLHGNDFCPFLARCPYATAVCRSQRPPLRATPTGTMAACHNLEFMPRPGQPVVSGRSSS